MSKLPQLKRLTLEDFIEQKSWISKLFLILNPFMESVVQSFDSGLTIAENMSGDILTVTLSAFPSTANPVVIGWSKKARPVAVMVGGVKRVDGADFVLSSAVGIAWKWTNSGLSIVQVSGIGTLDESNKYILTLVAFAG